MEGRCPIDESLEHLDVEEWKARVCTYVRKQPSSKEFFFPLHYIDYGI